MDTLRRRARGASSSLLGCLWAALAAWLWIGAAAPLDGLSRLAAADASEGEALVSADRGHAHDPAREPPTSAVESSEPEPELEDDDFVGEEPRIAAGQLDEARKIAPQADETNARLRDPSVAQHYNRGPPRA